MNDNLEIDESAGKLLILERIKTSIENGQDESFMLHIARNFMSATADLDKLCRRYRRTWEAEGVTTRPKLRLGKDSAELW